MPRNAFDDLVQGCLRSEGCFESDAPKRQKDEAKGASKDKSKRSCSRARSSSGASSKVSVKLKDECSKRRQDTVDENGGRKRRRSSSASRKRLQLQVKRRRTPGGERKRSRSRGRRSRSGGRSVSNGSGESRSASTLQLRVRQRDPRGPARKAPSPEPKRTPARRVLRCQHSDEAPEPHGREADVASWPAKLARQLADDARQFRGRGNGPQEPTPRRLREVQATPAPRQAKGVVRDAGFSVLYWGGAGKDRPWDFDHRGSTPQLCRQCDGITDTWRGRFDNAQATLRMCGAEGSGFKRYVHEFAMMSGKGVAEFHLPTFYRWMAARGTKVLTERMVIGSLLETYHGCHLPRDCGIRATNEWGGWERALRHQCERFQEAAHKGGGKFCALVLDEHGSELRICDMVRVHAASSIGRLLIVLGGPDGIAPKQAEDMKRVLAEYTDLPLFRCALPGGKMHSYYALSTLFMLHDQGLLLPFLSHLSGEHPQTPVQRRREGLDSVPSPVKHSPVDDRTDRLQSPEAPGMVSLRNGPLEPDEVLKRRAARFGGGLTSPEGARGKMDRGPARLSSPDAPPSAEDRRKLLEAARGNTGQSPKRRAPSAEGRTRRSPEKSACGIVERTPSPLGRGECSGQSHTRDLVAHDRCADG